MAPESQDQNRAVYQRFARYYDAYVGAFDQDLPIYIDSISQEKSNKILEIGCGTGRVLQVLLKTGSTVTGVDISEDMLKIARHRFKTYLEKGQLILQNHNFIYSPLPEQFEQVFVTFYTFNYLLTIIQANHFLQNIYSSMSDGAVLIMDLFFPAALANPGAPGEWSQRTFYLDGIPVLLSDRRTMEGRLEKREQSYQENELRSKIVTYRRFYSTAETSAMLKDAGFNQIMLIDAYNKEAFREFKADEEPKAGFMIKAYK